LLHPNRSKHLERNFEQARRRGGVLQNGGADKIDACEHDQAKQYIQQIARSEFESSQQQPACDSGNGSHRTDQNFVFLDFDFRQNNLLRVAGATRIGDCPRQCRSDQYHRNGSEEQSAKQRDRFPGDSQSGVGSLVQHDAGRRTI
jgi:hypothetical protein